MKLADNDFLWAVIGLLVVIILLIMGCSPIYNGAVQSKEFIPEHEIQVDDPDITIGDITIPGGSHEETVPDQWFITIGKTDEDGKWKTNTFRVDEQTYNAYTEGDWADFGNKQ